MKEKIFTNLLVVNDMQSLKTISQIQRKFKKKHIFPITPEAATKMAKNSLVTVTLSPKEVNLVDSADGVPGENVLRTRLNLILAPAKKDDEV